MPDTSNISKTSKKIEATKIETAKPEQKKEEYKDPNAWQIFLHNTKEIFDPLFSGVDRDTVQFTNAHAKALYPLSALVGPVLGAAAIVSGIALATSGLIRFIAASVLSEPTMEEGTKRVFDGLKMATKGSFLLVTTAISPISTPLYALSQKLTGHDFWKSFSEMMGYREVNKDNPLNLDAGNNKNPSSLNLDVKGGPILIKAENITMTNSSTTNQANDNIKNNVRISATASILAKMPTDSFAKQVAADKTQSATKTI